MSETEVQPGDLVKRHRLSTRLWHWTNAVAILIMLMSGLMISNAHPHLYWGEYGANFDHPWLNPPTFPGWVTIPSGYNLALARHWHLAFAWVLAVSFAVYLVVSLFSRHLQRDLTLERGELAPTHLWEDIKHHAQLKFPTGAAMLKYNTLQKLTYIGVLFVLLPLVILTGLCLSPGVSPLTTWAIDLFGGRSTARSIHFLCAIGIGAFIALHVSLVILAGPYNEIRSMITGKLRIEGERKAAQDAEAAAMGEPA